MPVTLGVDWRGKVPLEPSPEADMPSQTPEIIAHTGPTSSGEMLWRVAYRSSYYDSDPRGSGDVAVGATAFVLARSRDEALQKAESVGTFALARTQRGKSAPESVTATIATLEEFVAAEDVRKNHTGPGYPMQNLRGISLSHPDDQVRYRLAVCLVPIR